MYHPTKTVTVSCNRTPNIPRAPGVDRARSHALFWAPGPGAQALKYILKYVLEYIPEYIYEYIPKYVPEYIPKCISKYIPKHIAKYIPKYIPKYVISRGVDCQI